QPGVVEHALEGHVPVDQRGLLGPETFPVLDRTSMEGGQPALGAIRTGPAGRRCLHCAHRLLLLSWAAQGADPSSRVASRDAVDARHSTAEACTGLTAWPGGGGSRPMTAFGPAAGARL